MIENISSKDNKTLKLIRQLKKKNGRADNRKFIAEGIKMVREALVYVPKDLCCVVASDELFAKEPELIKSCDAACGRVYLVPECVFDELSDTDTPQGVLAVINWKDKQFNAGDSERRIVVLDGISEPGNMGTIIRTAEAIGYDAIYLMKGCTDIYAPKTVRSTMGSIFRMNFKSGCTASDIDELKELGFTVIATTPSGVVALEEYKAPEKCAIIIGNEAHGVSQEIMEKSDVGVRITMDGMAESLNAAVAAGIVMHWINLK